MRVNLKVHYAERHEVKRLGAKWDPGRKTWYVENVENLEPFLRWVPAHLTRPHEPTLGEIEHQHLREVLDER